MHPIKSIRAIRYYSVYDFEWVPGTLEMRVAGCFDGQRYIPYRTVDDFLDSQLTSDNNGRWFFAHYGGAADVQFVLEKLIDKKKYHIRAIFSGSSAIMVTVKCKRTKNRWMFLDSFWLLRTRLEKIGEKLGLYKSGPTDDMDDYERKCWYTDVPLDELTDYNEQDCRILYVALQRLEATLLELGGQLRITIASTALDLFLRKYLKSELGMIEALNRWGRIAYTASRVEVIQKYVNDAKYYDINSSFPYSMTKPLPGTVKDITSSRLPSEGLFLANCTVKVPHSCFIPPLPYRTTEHLFFPTGQWSSYFFRSDLETLEQAGGEILKVGDVINFDPFWDLKAYAEDIYAYKARATGFEREIFKLLLNSLYGKFAERSEKQVLHINPSIEVMERLEWRDQKEKRRSIFDGKPPDRRSMIRPGMWIEKKDMRVDHAHVVLSAAITSYSRQSLWEYMVKARESYYCDTDGVAVSTDTVWDVDNNLGGLKLEKVLKKGEFLQPKLYKMTTTEGKEIYKAKGFSLGKTDKERKENFDDIASGREIEISRMRRIRESLTRGGAIVPMEDLIHKKLQRPIEKRCFDKEGKSRPWSVKEISTLTER